MSAAVACECLECRIRAACAFKADEAVDIMPALAALGNVTAELLAHLPSREAKRFAQGLLDASESWRQEPRVAVQQEPMGRA